MTVNTAKVTGRRELHFDSLAAILADAEQLAAAPRVRALGNWTLAQAIAHLTRTMNGSLDGLNFRAPWLIRVVVTAMKKRMLTRPMSAGFRLPSYAAKELIPENAGTLEDAMAAFRRAIHRLQTESQRKPSPVLGQLTREQWDQLHERHAELHLSFFVTDPVEFVP